MKNNKAVTLIALVITIVILVIIGGVAVGLTIGENGIINRAKQAAMMQKKAQYFEEIGLEIIQEQTERYEKAKEEAFILSINERLTGQKQASNQPVSSYSKKSWIESTTMCDEEKNIHLNPFDNNRLYVYTTEGYELIVIINNQSLTASIEEDSFKKSADKVNVTYNANGGTGSVGGQSVLPGFKVTLNENGFTRDRYTFTGWCLNQDGTGDKYQPGSDLRITEDCTLYAVWSLNTATVTFDSNTGEGEMAPRDLSVGEEYQLTKNTFTKEGYTFSKWTINANGTGDEYTDESNITIYSDTTLYAQWEAETYTITYALSGGSISGEKTTYTIEDEAFTLPTPTKNGYTFAGWTGTGLNFASTSVTVQTGSTGPRAYTATWTAVSYNITYNLNGGTGVSNRTYTIEDSVTLPTPSKNNFVFTGWTGSNGTTAQKEVTIPVGSTGDKSYTANWVEDLGDIYLYNLGDENDSITGGWYGEANGGGGQISKDPDNLYIYGRVVSHGTQGGGGYYLTNNYIDITNYTQLVITYGYYFSYYPWGSIYASPEPDPEAETQKPSISIFNKSPNTSSISSNSRTDTINISSYTGKYKFVMSNAASATSGNYSWIRLYSLQLKK